MYCLDEFQKKLDLSNLLKLMSYIQSSFANRGVDYF
jgi:hypothetical protein